MTTSSFTYEFIVPVGPPADDTRDPVIIDVDFSPVFATPSSIVRLVYIALSGMRKNNTGAAATMSSPADFSVRLLGNFDSNNAPLFTVAIPKPGDSINPFDGITLSANNPYNPLLDTYPITLPRTFQIEFNPSSQPGATPNDKITMFFTIGYVIL